MGNTLLLENDSSGTCKKTTIRRMKKINRNKINKRFHTYLELYTKQFYLVYIHFLQELSPTILTVISPWYLLCCFPIIFLEGYCPTSFSEKILVTSLHLDPTTQKVSRVASSAKILSWSCFKYSNHFLSTSFSTSLHFLAFFLVLALVIFLIF